MLCSVEVLNRELASEAGTDVLLTQNQDQQTESMQTIDNNIVSQGEPHKSPLLEWQIYAIDTSKSKGFYTLRLW